LKVDLKVSFTWVSSIRLYMKITDRVNVILAYSLSVI